MSKTAFLEPMEDLAYRRMLDHCYLTEMPLPENVEEIAMLIRMRSHCDSIKVVLRYFFELTAYGYVNDRVKREIGAYNSKSSKAKASAEARWEKERNRIKELEASIVECEGNANALSIECKGNANQEPRTINHKPLTINNISESDKPTRFMFKKELLDLGCNSEIVDSYMALRKTKKASNSKIAFDGLIREQQKSGMNLDDVMRLCVEKGWRGFDASWVNKPVYQNGYQQPQNTRMQEIEELSKKWEQDNESRYQPY